MTVSYQFTFDELAALYRKESESTKRSSKGIAIYWYGVVPVITLFVALISSLGVAVAAMILYFGSGQVLNHYYKRAFWKSFLKPEDLALALLPFSATANDEGISFDSAGGSAFYRWGYVQSVTRFGAYVRVTISSQMCHHIPHRALGSADEVSAFIDFGQKQISQAGRSTVPSADH